MFSERQEEFLFDGPDAFINIADGAVRSGKTFASLFRFAEFACQHTTGDLIITGKTERTIKRNVVSPMIELFGRTRVRYVQGAGELYLSGRRIYLIGANDESAEEKIRGFTARGAYCNELALHPESVFHQIIDRCSLPEARIFGDTNPDSPFHWLNEKFLENHSALTNGDVRRVRFALTDNPTLPPDYVSRLYRLHSGVWLKRMVHGLWVAAEGAIYDMFEPDGPLVVSHLHEQSSFDLARVGVDYGTHNPTVFLLLARERATDRWHVVKEYFYDSIANGRQKTDSEYAADFGEFISGWEHLLASIEVDPSAASFKLQLKRSGQRLVKSAINEVLDGIRSVGAAFNTERLFVHVSCRQTIKSLSVYAWDPKAQARGEDKPIKINDHPADALRYVCMRIFGRPNLRVLKKPRGV